jgi:hypothetical protein
MSTNQHLSKGKWVSTPAGVHHVSTKPITSSCCLWQVLFYLACIVAIYLFIVIAHADLVYYFR